MEDQFDHIEEYLRGELSTEEQARFESRMEENPDLKEKVETYRQLLKGIELGFNQELKQLLMEEESRLPHLKQHQTNRIKSLYPIIGVAAAVSLLIIAFFTFRNKTIDTAELYAQYYQPYPNVEAPISRSDSQDLSPYSLYENGNYNNALQQFSELRSSNPDDPALLFYSAICQLEMDSTNDAVTSLNQLLDMGTNKYTRPAKWYLSLAYLKFGNSSKAISSLRDLAGMDDVYAKKAAEILNEID